MCVCEPWGMGHALLLCRVVHGVQVSQLSVVRKYSLLRRVSLVAFWMCTVFTRRFDLYQSWGHNVYYHYIGFTALLYHTHTLIPELCFHNMNYYMVLMHTQKLRIVADSCTIWPPPGTRRRSRTDNGINRACAPGSGRLDLSLG